jgi:hypothetical protein
MKRIMTILCLSLVFTLCWIGMARAVTLTATPSPAYVGQNVLVNVNALVTVAPCPITVSYGEGPPTILTCSTTGPCVRSLSHIYNSASTYLLSASGPVASACTAAPGSTINLLVTCPPLGITTAALPNGIVGQPYSYQLQASGGVPPLTWGVALDGEGLPAGLTMSPTGLISGIPKAYGTKMNHFFVTDNCAPVTQTVYRTLNLTIATPATSELRITRMQLSFDNERAEITVKRNQPGLKARVDIRFDGSGLLRGYWEVDGRILSNVSQNLVYGNTLRLSTPDIPFLPTFADGTHRVRFVITQPAQEIEFPQAIYYVTADESAVSLVPLRLETPLDHAEADFGPLAFQWNAIPGVAMYLVEFYRPGDEPPVFSAYTRELGYTLPEQVLKDVFAAGKAYAWKVRGYDEAGNQLAESPRSSFSFRP